MKRHVRVHRLGSVPYGEAHELQERLVNARIRGAIGDTLLLLEHPKVITLGRGAKSENILMTPERLTALGFEVHEIGRGGDVTYHGPGQIVGYPILDLRRRELRAADYVRELEALLVDVLATFHLDANVVAGRPGVWVDGAKIAAIGVAIRGGVSSHGFALNVAPDLGWYDAIVPCGLTDASVTSMAALLDAPPAVDEVAAVMSAAFERRFDAQLVEADPSALLGMVNA